MEIGFLFGFFIISAISFGIFLLVRQIMLWYFKINTIVREQQTTNQLLNQILWELKSAKPAVGRVAGSVEKKVAPADAASVYLYHSMDNYPDIFAILNSAKYKVPFVPPIKYPKGSGELVYLKEGKYMLEFYQNKAGQETLLSRLPIDVKANEELFINAVSGINGR